MSVCTGVSECTGGPGLFSLGPGTPQAPLALQLPHMGGLVTTDGTPTLWSHEVPAPTTAKAAPAGAGEESQGNPALQLRSGAQAHTCTHACAHTLTCTHRTFCLWAVWLTHTSCLGAPSVTVTACAEPQLTCGPVQGMTTRPGGSQPQGWWKPQSLRFLEPNGAVSVGKSSFPWPVLPSPLQPRALGHTDQSQLREKWGWAQSRDWGVCQALCSWAGPNPAPPVVQGRAGRPEDIRPSG